MLKFYNTASSAVEDFKPISPKEVRLYTCGPTVYDFAHIGNLRTYIFEDLLKRTLEYSGCKVLHAMNITDVGHLTGDNKGDADTGEDRMDKGAKREGKHPLEIARMYEQQFFKDLAALNIEPPNLVARATDTIAEQIELIKELEQKGFTYQDEFAIYFNTAKFPEYGKLSGQKLGDKKVGSREDVVVDIKKQNPQDFVLWFFLAGRYKDHILQWDSPWGKGFPGWHIECSAISRKLLGQPFDIHTGGVDHIGTHHTNEIAQSEAAFGMPLANLWMHGEFLLIDEGRMGKSEGNAYTLKTITDKGFSAMDYRYFTLGAHFRTQLNFTWQALEASHVALEKLYDFARSPVTPAKEADSKYEEKFTAAIASDLNIPKALGIVWEMLGDKTLDPAVKLAGLLKFDKVLGLGLDNPPKLDEAPAEVLKLIEEREVARTKKDFATSDEIRKKVFALGYEILDTKDGSKAKKI